MNKYTLTDEGYILYLQHKNDEALKKYNQALRFKGKSPRVLYNRGLVYQQLGYDDKAKRDFYKALLISKSSVEQNRKDLNSKNLMGLAYFELGHFNKAIEIFDKIIRFDNRNSDALRNRGLVYCRQKEYEKAVKDLNEAIKLNNQDIEALYNLGLLYYKIKENQKGHEAFKKLLKTNPEYINGWYTKGTVHYVSSLKLSGYWEKEENLEKAIECFKSALKLNPKFSLAFNSLGRLYLTQHNYDKAAEEFNKAVNIDDKEKINAYKNLGLLYFKQQKFDDALIEFEKAEKINPKDNILLSYISHVYKRKKQEDKSLVFKGRILYYKEKYERAIKVFNKVKENSAEYPIALKWIGNCYYSRKKECDYEEAIDKYRKSLKRESFENNRDRVYLLLQIGNCYFKLKNCDKALSYYDKACKNDPNFIDIYYNSGLVYSNKGNYIESVRKYKKAIELDPKHYSAHNNMSYSLYNMEKYKESLQACNRCLECKVNHENALINKGLIHLRLGQYKEALKAVDKAVELFPSNDEAWRNKGSVHYFLEQFDEAHKAFDEVIKLNKRYVYVISSWESKGVIYAKCGNCEKAKESFSKAKEIINEKINKEIKNYIKRRNKSSISNNIYAQTTYEEYLKITEKNEKKYLIPLLLRESFVFILFGKYQKALGNLDHVCQISPTRSKQVILLSKLKRIVYEKLGNYDGIEQSFEKDNSYLDKILEHKGEEDYKADIYCEKGVVLRERGNYNGKFNDSIEVFKTTLQENPSLSNSMYELGNTFRKLGESYQALKYFEEAIQTNQYYSEAWINKALVLRGLLEFDKSEHSYKRAISILETAIKLNNNYSVAHYLIGLIHFDHHDYEKALICFERASRSKDYHEDSEINKGLALFNLKRCDEAIYVFDSIINDNESESKKAKVDSLNNKGIVLLSQKKEKLAYDQFTRASALDPHNAESKNNMGVVKYSQKKYRHAFKLFDESICLEMKYSHQALANACSNKGILLFKMGKFEEAKKAFDEAIRIHPEYTSARKNKGKVLCMLGEHKEALKTFEEASLIRPKEGKINLLLAGSLLKLGDIQRADEEIEKVFRDSTISLHEKSDAYNIKGQIKIEKFDYCGAIDSFEKAIYFNPSNFSLLVWKAYAEYLKADFLISQKNQNQSQNQNQSKKQNSEKQNSETINAINKEYQEKIFHILRELEKISIEFNKKQKSTNLYLLFWLRLQSIVSKLEKLTVFFHRDNKLENKSKKQKKICRFSDLKDYINLSTMEHDCEKINEEKIIDAYVFYFTGYLYYKISDFNSALSKLKKCIEINGGENINNPAKNLIQTIWEYQIRPPFWKWWLYSPINKWKRRMLFGLISILIFALLFPYFTESLFTSLIHSLPIMGSLKEELNSLISSLLASENNTNQYIAIGILVLMLLFPSIEQIKAKDLEITLKDSPAPFVDICPLTPAFTPKESTMLMQIKTRPKPLELYEFGKSIVVDSGFS